MNWKSSMMCSSEEDLDAPIIDCVLHAGDLLYFPRGYIHQGNALQNEHSLHITVSMFQKHTYHDLLTSHLLPMALSKLQQTSSLSRASLPAKYLDACGSCSSPSKSAIKMREQIVKDLTEVTQELVGMIPNVVDEAVDQFSLK